MLWGVSMANLFILHLLPVVLVRCVSFYSVCMLRITSNNDNFPL